MGHSITRARYTGSALDLGPNECRRAKTSKSSALQPLYTKRHSAMKRNQPDSAPSQSRNIILTEEDFVVESCKYQSEPLDAYSYRLILLKVFRFTGHKYDCTACTVFNLTIQQALRHEGTAKHIQHVREQGGCVSSDPFGPTVSLTH